MTIPSEHAIAETERIAALFPRQHRNNIRAAVGPLAQRCEELAATVAKLERERRKYREAAVDRLNALLVEFVDGN